MTKNAMRKKQMALINGLFLSCLNGEALRESALCNRQVRRKLAGHVLQQPWLMT